MAEKFRYRVDNRKTIFTHTLEEAREYALAHQPAVILERVENEGQFRRELRILWCEVERYELMPGIRVKAIA
ncbi:MAG: hypothetical protein HY318_05610 [Armatimonadetes bacterium]|nr:hypothetical protein [Armatimonadota bacterium]